MCEYMCVCALDVVIGCIEYSSNFHHCCIDTKKIGECFFAGFAVLYMFSIHSDNYLDKIIFFDELCDEPL